MLDFWTHAICCTVYGYISDSCFKLVRKQPWNLICFPMLLQASRIAWWLYDSLNARIKSHSPPKVSSAADNFCNWYEDRIVQKKHIWKFPVLFDSVLLNKLVGLLSQNAYSKFMSIHLPDLSRKLASCSSQSWFTGPLKHPRTEGK
jgi:hypothetical protein